MIILESRDGQDSTVSQQRLNGVDELLVLIVYVTGSY